MNVLETKQFAKDFKNLPVHIKTLVANAYENVLAAKTVHEIHSCRKLKGSTNRYRIRIGTYRILFLVIIKDNRVEFRRVLPRGQAYK